MPSVLPDSVTHRRRAPILCLSLAAKNVDLGRTNESRVSSPPSVPDSLPPPTIRGDTSKLEFSQTADDGDNAPSKQQDLTDSTLRGLGHTTE
jgi:hypothetical protein